MAPRGTSKWLSQWQEKRVAKTYGGVVSPSSGASDTDAGDVRTPTHLIECKHTGSFLKSAKSISVKLDVFEKIADEAWSESRAPAQALSIYAPDSVLADPDGFVDLIVYLQSDDAERH